MQKPPATMRCCGTGPAGPSHQFNQSESEPMKFHNIGVMSPGDMGQAVAQQLKQNGFNVYTALDKRSARTKSLAQQAGLTDVGSIENLTEKCEVILSIVSSGAALDLANEVGPT